MNKIKKLAYMVGSMVAAAPMVIFTANAADDKTSGTVGFQDPNQAAGGTLPSGSIGEIITNIMNWLLMVVGIVGVIGFIISGILYMTAAGNDDQIKKAKKAMVFSIVGVLVALVGVVAIGAIKTMLGGQSTAF